VHLLYTRPSWSQYVSGIAIIARFERLVGDKSSDALIGAILSLNLGPSECEQRYMKFLHAQWI